MGVIGPKGIQSQNRTLGQVLVAARRPDVNDSVFYHSLLGFATGVPQQHSQLPRHVPDSHGFVIADCRELVAARTPGCRSVVRTDDGFVDTRSARNSACLRLNTNSPPTGSMIPVGRFRASCLIVLELSPRLSMCRRRSSEIARELLPRELDREAAQPQRFFLIRIVCRGVRRLEGTPPLLR